MPYADNRFFDDMAKFMTDAVGAAQGARREFEALVRAQVERFTRDLDLPNREEVEAVKEMARLAREENERLAARIAELERRLDAAVRDSGLGAAAQADPL